MARVYIRFIPHNFWFIKVKNMDHKQLILMNELAQMCSQWNSGDKKM